MYGARSCLYSAKRLPEAACRIIDRADAIIHAGDCVSPEFFTELTQRGRIFAVRGNNDSEIQNLSVPQEVELAGVRIVITHDSGNKDGRRKRMRKLFPRAKAVILGSPTDKRRQPAHTMGIPTIESGFIRGEIVELD